jgi:hypothetical protein
MISTRGHEGTKGKRQQQMFLQRVPNFQNGVAFAHVRILAF